MSTYRERLAQLHTLIAEELPQVVAKVTFEKVFMETGYSKAPRYGGTTHGETPKTFRWFITLPEEVVDDNFFQHVAKGGFFTRKQAVAWLEGYLPDLTSDGHLWNFIEGNIPSEWLESLGWDYLGE